jgi:formylglycine-generating enzyme required for sulfatase activity
MHHSARPTTYTQFLPSGFSFELIHVPAGSFYFGYSKHEITLPEFYLAQYPVTQELWLEVLGGENPAYFPGAKRPVECVSWYDAAAFCNVLNAQCGFLPRYFVDAECRQALDIQKTLPLSYPDTLSVFVHLTKPGYRLPSEAAWEYAAIGARQRAQYEYAGGNQLDELAWYDQNSHGQTQPVGLKLPNELGIHDLSGNVWEWCEDQYQNRSEEIPLDGSATVNRADDVSRVIRGGCWYNLALYCRPSCRHDDHPALRGHGVGFRVVLVPPPEPRN